MLSEFEKWTEKELKEEIELLEEEDQLIGERLIEINEELQRRKHDSGKR